MAHTEEAPELIVMPQGPETFAGRYPGYKPAQAMAAFLSVPDLHRLSYDVLVNSYWGISLQRFGVEYELVLGCFAEPDGTPVIVVTYLAEPEHSRSTPLFMCAEKWALQASAHSTKSILAEDWISRAVPSGALRQLRPYGVGSIPCFRENVKSAVVLSSDAVDTASATGSATRPSSA